MQKIVSHLLLGLMLPEDMHLHSVAGWTDSGTKLTSHTIALDVAALNVVHHALSCFGCVFAMMTLLHTVLTSGHQLLNSEVQVWE